MILYAYLKRNLLLLYMVSTFLSTQHHLLSIFNKHGSMQLCGEAVNFWSAYICPIGGIFAVKASISTENSKKTKSVSYVFFF